MSSADADAKAITLGHPSYVWRFGQDRRLAMIERYAPLEGRRILDTGCGVGMYVRAFRQFSEQVYGIDVDPDKSVTVTCGATEAVTAAVLANRTQHLFRPASAALFV